MGRAFVIDACSFRLFYKELIEERVDVATEFITRLFEDDFVALDENGRMVREWTECCCGEKDELLTSWIRARTEEDRVRILPHKNPRGMKEALDKLGMPKKDRLYLYFAAHNKAHLVVSEDIDFFDPKAKCYPVNKKEKIKACSKGCICSYMKKTFNIQISTVQNASSHV